MSDEKTNKDSHYARLRRQFRDQKAGGPVAAARPQRKPIAGSATPDGVVRLYGLHTVRAALDNPERRIKRMLITRNAIARLEIEDVSALPFPVEQVEPRAIDKETGSDAVHQGVLLEALPLTPKKLSQLSDCPLLLGLRCHLPLYIWSVKSNA